VQAEKQRLTLSKTAIRLWTPRTGRMGDPATYG